MKILGPTTKKIIKFPPSQNPNSSPKPKKGCRVCGK